MQVAMEKGLLFLFCFTSLMSYSYGLYCYECVSTHPGCGSYLNWIFYWGIYCPESNDRCVKVIEKKDDQEIITRACLSSLTSFRSDIPADKYEGCRPAARDDKLGNYVNHTISQHDVKRDHYDEVNWCFCYFDDRCNSATTISLTFVLGTVISFPYLLS